MKVKYPKDRIVCYCDVCGDTEDVEPYCKITGDDGCGHAWNDNDSGDYHSHSTGYDSVLEESGFYSKKDPIWDKYGKDRTFEEDLDPYSEVALPYIVQAEIHLCQDCRMENFDNHISAFENEIKKHRSAIFLKLDEEKKIPEFVEEEDLVQSRLKEVETKLNDIYKDIANNKYRESGIESRFREAFSLALEYDKLLKEDK